jgi:acetyltransferase-like isoleucine patch superfamily enzyme
MTFFSHETAEIDSSVKIGQGSKIWGNSRIREESIIGTNVIIGFGVYIGPGVIIGNNVKIQNAAQIYEPSVIEDGVFIGPGAILTNDRYPRAVKEDGELKTEQDWIRSGVTIRMGASIGAGAILIAPVEIGEWSLIGAGAVVTSDIPSFSLGIGVPAKVVRTIEKSIWPV